MVLKIPKAHKGKPFIAQRQSASQEKRVADSIGATVVKGSGRGDEKGDSRLKGVVRIENKNTTHNQRFCITREMAQKIEDAALQCGEVPIIEFEFIDQTGRIEHSLVVVPAYVLKTIVQVYEEGAV